jgi:hypothetical protein
MGKPVTGLRPQLMFKFSENICFNLPLNNRFEAKYIKYLLRKEYSPPFLFILQVKTADLLQCERSE